MRQHTCSTVQLSLENQDLKDFGELIMLVLVLFCLLSFSVDASWESGRFGRLVNHSKKRPNCEVRVFSPLFH